MRKNLPLPLFMFQQQFSDIRQLDRLQFSSSWTPTIQVIGDPVKGSAPRAPCSPFDILLE